MITFWFDFASTYSYIAAERLRRRGAVPPTVVWRPFLLGPVFKELGWNGSPVASAAPKLAYMWRDLERLAARLDLPFQRPDPFPQRSILANRVAIAHADAPWLADFACGVFRAEFGEGADIARADVLRAVLAGLGLDAEAALAAAERPETKEALRAATEAAMEAGVFGAPSFTVDGELFWGQDRLDDALAWAGL
jgi:2-hydroxychromene-2-carboxylate isomerase